jgi:hypothetical protein
MDDLKIIGPIGEVLTAFRRLKEHAREFSLELCVDKCSVMLPESLSPGPETSTAIETASTAEGLRCSRSMKSLGVMYGPNSDVEEFCHATAAAAAPATGKVRTETWQG